MTLPDFYKQFNKDIEWINHNTVYLARHGSRAYNTHTPESDEDFKGICIPTKPYFLGSIQRFEQAELKDPDTAIYEIRKFFKLAAESNPNIIEVLYVDDSDVLYQDEIGKQIREMRDQFLSKRVKHTFMGYAISQLKRIKLHRRYLLNPPTKEPTRTDFGLPEQTIIPRDQLMAAEAEVRKEIDRFHFDFMEDLTESTKISIRETVNSMLSELKITSDAHWNAAARKVGLTDNFIEAMQKERAYKGARAEWEQYHNWKKTRNKKRFETEEKYGYDVKHGYHLVRLCRMCEEILTTGKVIVRRHDRDELMDIRNGKMPFDVLMNFAEQMDEKLQDIYEACAILPRTPDFKAIDKILIQMIERSFERDVERAKRSAA